MSPFGLPSAGYPASARWHVFRSRRSAAFTLLEVLVATAVLALMMTFLFNLLGSSAKLWETGNKKIEAAQAARVGLNIIAKDLKNAFAGNMTSYTSTGTPVINISPFLAQDAPRASDVVDLSGGAENAAGSQQLFGVLSSGDSDQPYKEFGYLCVFMSEDDGARSMIGNRYYLVRKLANGTADKGNFFLRAATDSWAEDSTDFSPVVDNCIRLKLEYYGNQSDPTETPDWTTPSGSWTPRDRLPLGVLVTISALDSKTAEKIAILSNLSPLSADNITRGLNAASGNGTATNDIQRLISQGSVTMSRFIPFNSN
jgi:type II secretory pathway pseudopilin PulG